MSTLTWVIVAIVILVVIALVIVAMMRRRGQELRQLPAQDRDRYLDSWRAIELRFVDDPRQAVTEADHLAVAIYRQRGGREQEMPERVREARGMTSPGAEDSTEGLRRSMQSYRAAIDELLGTDSRARRGRQEVA